MAQGADASEKFLSLIAVLPGALQSFWQSWGPWGDCSWSGSPFSSESHCSEIQDQHKVQYPHGFPSEPNHIPNHVDISWRSFF